MMARNYEKKICQNCGTEFTPKTGNQSYCYDLNCKKERVKKSNKARMQKWQETNISQNVQSHNVGIIDQAWPWQIGDKLKFEVRAESLKKNKLFKTGIVIEIYPRYLVVQLEKYRVTLLKADWLTGQVKAKKVG